MRREKWKAAAQRLRQALRLPEVRQAIRDWNALTDAAEGCWEGADEAWGEQLELAGLALEDASVEERRDSSFGVAIPPSAVLITE